MDNNECKKEHLSKKVIQPDKLKEQEYDAVLVVNLYSNEIYRQSIELGLDLSKFIFCYANCDINDMNKDYAFVEAYKYTSLKLVLDRMTNLDNVIIKQGYFPESLDNLEDKFAFVSLDVDFEESIYEGLKYFYPRLVKGGYIFVHDYNSNLLGVEAAVDRYEDDYGIMLCKVPLCDKSGTLVVTK